MLQKLNNSLAFSINSVQQARQFDEFLAQYQKSNEAITTRPITLEHAFPVIDIHVEKGQLMAYFTELQLQHTLLNCDLCEIKQLIELDSSQSNAADFQHRIALFRANSDFILRYRAIWDKVMAIVILLLAPDQFKKFADAKNSRKDCFRKIAQNTGLIPQEFVDHVIETTISFDNKYRTNEAHGSGAARKLSVSGLPSGDESPQLDMLWAWSDLNVVMVKLGNAFRKAADNLANNKASLDAPLKHKS